MTASSPARVEHQRSFGHAWVALAAALALHVTDEAAHNFLAIYNPAVRAIRARLPFLPVPTFTFPVWLGGLIAGVCLLLLLAPLAYRGSRRLAMAAIPLGVLMVLNGCGHLAASVYTRTLVAGVWSSPALIAVSIWLVVSAYRRVHLGRRSETTF